MWEQGLWNHITWVLKPGIIAVLNLGKSFLPLVWSSEKWIFLNYEDLLQGSYLNQNTKPHFVRSTPRSEWELAKAKWETVAVSSAGDPASFIMRTMVSSRPSETSLVIPVLLTCFNYPCYASLLSFYYDEILLYGLCFWKFMILWNFWFLAEWVSPWWLKFMIKILLGCYKDDLCFFCWNTGSLILVFPLKGITLLNVSKLNILKLAPGGHVGRFCIWTEGAFRKLDELYGTWRKAASLKSNYKWV